MHAHGSIVLEGPESPTANRLCTLIFTYTAGTEPWKKGGRLYICNRHFSDMSKPQFLLPEAEGYTTARGGAEFSLSHDCWRNMLWHPWQHILEVRLESGELATGGNVTVTYGDRSGGGPGIRMQSFVEPWFRFRVFADPSGTGEFTELKHPSLEFPIGPAEWRRIQVIAPSRRTDGYLGRVKIRGMDRFGNTAPLPPGEMLLLTEDRMVARVPEARRGEGWVDVSLPLPDLEKLSDIRAGRSRSSEVIRVKAHHVPTGMEFESNPVTPADPSGERLLWGEIHAQSYVCDGTRYPDDLLRFAAEETRLDFASVTSHDCLMHDEEANFLDVVAASNRMYVPGVFTPIVGYEWSGLHARGGDHNIYFRNSEGRFLNSGHIINQVRDGEKEGYGDAYSQSTLPPWSEPWMHEPTRYSDLRAVYAALRPDEVMIIPHGGGRPANLDYHHPLLEPAIEIFSCHESYESLAHEALLRGYRMAFVGGSDDHRGAIGDSHPLQRDHGCNFTEHSGLVAAFARECTREGMWEAFQRKSVYATTGERIVLEFEMNGARMGASVSGTGDPRNFRVTVNGTNYLRQVELWRNTRLLHAWPAGRKMDLSLEYTDTDPLDKITWPTHTLWGKEVHPQPEANGIPIRRAEAVYFIRVIQVDGHMAWSSSIWMDRA